MIAAVELVKRLERGWRMCQQERDPDRKAKLEKHWCGLLRQYESQCHLEELDLPARMEKAS